MRRRTAAAHADLTPPGTGPDAAHGYPQVAKGALQQLIDVPQAAGVYLDQSLDRLASAHGDRPFTNGQALALGVPAHQLERAVRAGRLFRLRRGLYSTIDPARTTAWSLACARAAELNSRGVPAVLSSSAVAPTWDVPILASPPPPPTIIVPAGARTGSRGGVRIQLGEVHERDIVRLTSSDPHISYAVTSPLRTAIDLVREATLAPHFGAATLSMGLRRQFQWEEPRVMTWDGQRMHIDERRADWACAQRLLSTHVEDHILAAVARCPRRGNRSVRWALPLVQPAVETALEALSWARMVQAGLPLPQTQAWLRGASGREYRVDFWWPEFGVIGEADGAAKYASRADIMKEKSRQADLEVDGARFIRWVWPDAAGPAHFVTRLAAAFAR